MANAGRAFILALLGLFAGSGLARAQSGPDDEGALDLIRAIGSRSLGMGQAATAAGVGTETVWANPALIARGRREGSLDFRNKANAAEAEADLAGVFIAPIQNVGAVAVFVRYLNYGSQDVQTGPNSLVGSFNNTSLIIGASFATTFADRLALGLTAKQLRVRFSCTGDCTQLGTESANQPSVSALDVGGQLFLRKDSTLSLGAAVLNLGPKFQIKDSPQADPLPSRASVGLLVAPRIAALPDVRIRGAADVVARVSGGTGLGFRFGGEISYLERYDLRAGYMYKGPGEIDSPTIGFGVTSGKVHVNIAQMMTDLGSQSGRPTFLGLRYVF